MTNCKYCHADLPDVASFCSICGRSLHDNKYVPTFQQDPDKTIVSSLLHDEQIQCLLDRSGKAQVSFIPSVPSLIPPAPPEEHIKPDIASNELLQTTLALPDITVVSSPSQSHESSHVSSEHGLHHQPRIEHGEHHQPNNLHGLHHQPQAIHGNHQQPPVMHRAHGGHGQPVHAIHHQPQVVHAGHHQPSSFGRILHRTRQARHVKLFKGCQVSCLTMSISSFVVVVLVVSLVLLVQHITPGEAQDSPLVTMPTGVSLGQTMSVQGRNFTPHSQVSVTIDTHAHAGNSHTSIQRSQSSGYLLGPFTSIANQQSTTSVKAKQVNVGLAVGADGTFTAKVYIDQHWLQGSQHTLYVLGQDGKVLVSKLFSIKSNQLTPSLILCSNGNTNGSSAVINLGPIAEGQSQAVAVPFKLCTQGTGNVDWTSGWNAQQASWLHVEQSGHILAPQTYQLQISASATTLKAGTYTAKVTLLTSHSANNIGTIELTVTLLVQAKNDQACIQTNSKRLSLNSSTGQMGASQQQISIENCGAKEDWSAIATTNDGSNWLSVSPDNGTLDKNVSQQVTISANPADIGPGSYSGLVTIGNGSSNVLINVSFVVPADMQQSPTSVVPPPQPTVTKSPCLSVDTGQLNFSAISGGRDPVAQSVTIRNDNGCGSGSWSATVDQSWLSVGASSGTINADGQENVTVLASIAKRSSGTYTAHIVFSPGSAAVTVTLDVQKPAPPPPCITTDAGPLNITTMEGNTSSNDYQQVYFNNGANCGSGSWNARSDASWITLDTSSGTINAGASSWLGAIINESAVGTGVFTGHITFGPGSGSTTLTIVLNC